LIVEATGFKGAIEWDDTKPDGQPRRLFDVTKAEERFGYRSKIGLEYGIKQTVEWYLETQCSNLEK